MFIIFLRNLVRETSRRYLTEKKMLPVNSSEKKTNIYFQ